jgi:SAM-dependent methyltransferase
MPAAMTRGTLAFYERHGAEYHAATAHVDMDRLYEPFLRELPPAASILDAGCGCGRDTKAFAQRGYRVIAIDASPALARLAAAFTGQPCMTLALQDIAFSAAFDAVWACASLVHVPTCDAGNVVDRFARALKPGGVLYISVKEGDGERTAADGRLFCDYTVATLRALIAPVAALRELAVWTTADVRGSQHGRWLNTLQRKDGL